MPLISTLDVSIAFFCLHLVHFLHFIMFPGRLRGIFFCHLDNDVGFPVKIVVIPDGDLLSGLLLINKNGLDCELHRKEVYTFSYP